MSGSSNISGLASTGVNIGRIGVESLIKEVLKEFDLISGGGLEDQIMGALGRIGRASSHHSVTIHADMPYARWLEYGTAHAPAYPFLRPAVTKAKRGFSRKVQARCRKWQ